MDCPEARDQINGFLRGRLPPREQEALRIHLAACEACRRVEAVERGLDDLLQRELPPRRASERLLARLGRLAEDSSRDEGVAGPSACGRWVRWASPARAATLAVALVGVLLVRRSHDDQVARALVVSEAVSDHLRVLALEHGFDLVSAESHQVKPWFAGRIDFAPAVPIPDVADLRLHGGAVGYFLDRKAAVVGYTLRRHAVTLLAFRPDGLALSGAGDPGGRGRPTISALRGFRVATWRGADIGYALVSDVAPEEFDALATAFALLSAP